MLFARDRFGEEISDHLNDICAQIGRERTVRGKNQRIVRDHILIVAAPVFCVGRGGGISCWYQDV